MFISVELLSQEHITNICKPKKADTSCASLSVVVFAYLSTKNYFMSKLTFIIFYFNIFKMGLQKCCEAHLHLCLSVFDFFLFGYPIFLSLLCISLSAFLFPR